MYFFKTSVLYKSIYPAIILSILISSCSTKNSITDSNKTDDLAKPYEFEDIFSKKPPWNVWVPSFSNFAKLVALINTAEKANFCAFFVFGVPFDLAPAVINDNDDDLYKIYDFRDNYLLQSQKGKYYTAFYYLLSEYGIENNLMMKYPLEHIEILETGVEVSRKLQHGVSTNKILINHPAYTNLKNITKIYRNSENHADIDPILDYLEADLENYYNKTKSEIAVDFGF